MAGGFGERSGYASQATYAAGSVLTYEELDADHGPLRPVEPLSDQDRATITSALRSAGTRAVAMLAAALGAVWEDGLGRHSGQNVAIAQRALVAGRPSSWDAELSCCSR